MSRRFKSVAVGGTFDEFHKGHRTLLMKAFEVADHVLVGLSSDEFVKNMAKNHKTASYFHRLRDLRNFLRQNGFLDRAEIVCLDDPYGVMLTSRSVEALVVSKETENVALEIRAEREKAGLPLEIITIDMVPSDNHVSISTTRIRQGTIDREGHLLKTCQQ